MGQLEKEDPSDAHPAGGAPGQVLWKRKSTSQPAAVALATRMPSGIGDGRSPSGTQRGPEPFAPLTPPASAGQRPRAGIQTGDKRLHTCLKMSAASHCDTPSRGPRPVLNNRGTVYKRTAPLLAIRPTQGLRCARPTGTSWCQMFGLHAHVPEQMMTMMVTVITIY